MHKTLSKYKKLLTNWINHIGQLISDGKRSDRFFFMEKRKEDGERKNKAVTPRLAFPFFLKTAVKQGSFQKNQKFTFTK